jgi:DNA-binding response OmpR family regulator
MSASGKVLIVEDDAGIRSLLRALVHRLGFDSDGVDDGEKAMTWLGIFEPSVIVLDLLVPRVDGFDVLDKVAETMPHLMQRIIIVTAAGESLWRGNGHLKNVWCVRRKPFDIVELGVQIRKCAGGNGRASA